VLAAIVLAMLAALYRPLLLASASAELAAVKGIRVRLIGALYLWAVAVVVALTCETVGAILSTALLIGPAATGLRIARTPRGALITAAATGIVVVWLGVLLAYDSYYWPHPGWPVSFFVVALTLIAYAMANLIARIAGDR
jgi:zinc/manganese transport system permease protein